MPRILHVCSIFVTAFAVAVLVEETVVTDGSIVTGNSPDASQEFSAAVVKVLRAGN